MPRTASFNKQHVLHEAMLVFWEKGYNATSMQDLVVATKLNRSSIYNTFGDKLSLYREALAAYIKETQVQFAQALENATNSYEAIQLIFESFLPEIYQDSKGCMSMNCKAEMSEQPNIKQWLESTQEQMLNTFEQLIVVGQEEGSINNNQSARDYAWHVMNTFQGFRMTGILEKDPKTLKMIIGNGLSILA